MKKKHFSWSQLNLWETNKKQYIRKYFANEKQYQTKEMSFGKKFADKLYEENKINCELKIEAKLEDINLLSYIDYCYNDYLSFREIKTGKVEWDQKRADNHGQIYFYALIINIASGIKPKKAYLDWFPTTENENKEIIISKDKKTFEVKITQEKIKNMKKRIIKATKEISKEYKKFAKMRKDKINESKLKEYVEVEKKIKKLEEVKNNIKEEIKKDFKNNLVNDYKTEFGNFYITERKKFKYSSNVKDAKYKLKQLEKEEQKSADCEILTFLSFRSNKCV